jgi:hypothetical protein
VIEECFPRPIQTRKTVTVPVGLFGCVT